MGPEGEIRSNVFVGLSYGKETKVQHKEGNSGRKAIVVAQEICPKVIHKNPSEYLQIRKRKH